jgi:hypothetical protein
MASTISAPRSTLQLHGESAPGLERFWAVYVRDRRLETGWPSPYLQASAPAS